MVLYQFFFLQKHSKDGEFAELFPSKKHKKCHLNNIIYRSEQKISFVFPVSFKRRINHLIDLFDVSKHFVISDYQRNLLPSSVLFGINFHCHNISSLIFLDLFSKPERTWTTVINSHRYDRYMLSLIDKITRIRMIQ